MGAKLDSSKIVIVIPARYGSTRLPGKPLVSLSGQPMIQRVYERAKQAKTTVAKAHLVEAIQRTLGDEAVRHLKT